MPNAKDILARVHKAMHTLESVPTLVKEERWDDLEIHLEEAILQLNVAEYTVMDLAEGVTVQLNVADVAMELEDE